MEKILIWGDNLEEFLEHLRQDLNYSESTLVNYRADIKGYLVYIKFGKLTKESILEYANGRDKIRYRIDKYCKYKGYDFFKKEKMKIDYDIKNFIDTLDYTQRNKKEYAKLLQKYKHAKDKIEFINSYKEGQSRNKTLYIINQYRKYKKQKEIKLTSL